MAAVLFRFPLLKVPESLPDPKAVLQDFLAGASGRSGRRGRKFNFSARRARIPDFPESRETPPSLPPTGQLHDEIAALGPG